MHHVSRIAIVAFLLLSNTAFSADELSPQHLARVHLQRVHLYFGWEFHYTSSFTVDDGTSLELDNTLLIDSPLHQSSQIVRRLWTAYRDNPGEPHLDDPTLLHYFAGFNGKECRYYERKYLANTTGGANESTAQIFATEYVKYNDNFFDMILTSGPHALPQYLDVAGTVFDKHPAKFRVVGKGERLGIETLKLEAVTATKVRFEAEISDTPENLVMHLTISDVGSKPDLEWEITSVGKFENTLYPKSGWFHREPFEKLKQKDYVFNVQDVVRVDRSAEDWFPSWPAGTVVIDQTNGAKQNVIPYPPKALNQIKYERASSPVFRSIWTICFWALNLCGLGALAYIIIRRTRSK